MSSLTAQGRHAHRLNGCVGNVEHEPGEIAKYDRLFLRRFRVEEPGKYVIVKLDDAGAYLFARARCHARKALARHVENVQSQRPFVVRRIEDDKAIIKCRIKAGEA